MDARERRYFLSLLGRDLEVAAGELLGEPMDDFARRRVLVAGPSFWAVLRYNMRGRTGPPPTEADRGYADRVSGWGRYPKAMIEKLAADKAREAVDGG